MSIEGTEPALPGSEKENPGGSVLGLGNEALMAHNTSLLAPVVLGCGLNRYRVTPNQKTGYLEH